MGCFSVPSGSILLFVLSDQLTFPLQRVTKYHVLSLQCKCHSLVIRCLKYFKGPLWPQNKARTLRPAQLPSLTFNHSPFMHSLTCQSVISVSFPEFSLTFPKYTCFSRHPQIPIWSLREIGDLLKGSEHPRFPTQHCFCTFSPSQNNLDLA